MLSGEHIFDFFLPLVLARIDFAARMLEAKTDHTIRVPSIFNIKVKMFERQSVYNQVGPFAADPVPLDVSGFFTDLEQIHCHEKRPRRIDETQLFGWLKFCEAIP